MDPSDHLPPQGIKVEFTPAMKVIVREILAELATPPILVFLDWDAVADGSRPSKHTATRASTVLVLRLNRSSRTVHYGPLRISTTPPSIPRGTGFRSTWKLTALSGPSNAFEATNGARSFASSRI